MRFNWNPDPALDETAEEFLKDPRFVDQETTEYLQANPHKYRTFHFSVTNAHGGKSEGSLNVTFDLLLQVGNPQAIKRYIKAGDHYNLALVCSAPLRKQAQRAMTLSKFGDCPQDSEFWPECWEYFFVFSSDEVVNKHDEDDEWVLTPRAQAVSGYVHSQFRIYDNLHDSICQAYTREGEQLYHGWDRLSMYEVIYKELIK